MTLELPPISELKQQAKSLAAAKGISHGRALEIIAKSFGMRDWNTLRAARPQLDLRVNQRVTGSYLGNRFRGRVLSVTDLPDGNWRVNVAFDTPIDVVKFDSFSNFRTRANKAVDHKGVSIDRTSDGVPHMILDL